MLVNLDLDKLQTKCDNAEDAWSAVDVERWELEALIYIAVEAHNLVTCGLNFDGLDNLLVAALNKTNCDVIKYVR